MTLLDLIYAGYRIAGMLERARRYPNLEWQNEGVELYNRMVGTWANYQALVFQRVVNQFNLTASQQSYTIGTGGNFSMTRPSKIEAANLFIVSTPTIIRRPMLLLEDQQWEAKRVQNVLGPPLQLYNDYASPLSKLFFWPIPDKAYTFELYTWDQIAQATSPANVIQLPPGYEEAITHNLARRIVAMNPKVAEMSPEALKIASQTLAAIESRNTRSPRICNDAASMGAKRGPRADFNYYDGLPS